MPLDDCLPRIRSVYLQNRDKMADDMEMIVDQMNVDNDERTLFQFLIGMFIHYHLDYFCCYIKHPKKMNGVPFSAEFGNLGGLGFDAKLC